MTILQLLQSDASVRITLGKRWLVFNENTNEWQVYEHQYRRRNAIIVITTRDEQEAVAYLLDGENPTNQDQVM